MASDSRSDVHQLRIVMRAFSRMSPDGRLPALRWLVERITSDEHLRKIEAIVDAVNSPEALHGV